MKVCWTGPVIRVPSSAFHAPGGICTVRAVPLVTIGATSRSSPHQELVFDVLVAAVGEYVGQRAQDRFAGGGAGLGEFEDARREPHPQRHGLFDGGQMGGVQHAPWRECHVLSIQARCTP